MGLRFSNESGALPLPACSRALLRARVQGFGVVYLVVLIAAASLLLVTLVERGGLAIHVAGLGPEREKARYLALAGAEHAVWRLQHEACFLAQHRGATFTNSLAGGTYTYLVTGSNTGARVDATGSLGRASFEVHRSIDRLPPAARALVAYDRKSTSRPMTRDYVAGTWSAETQTAAITGEVDWCVLRAPVSRRERMLATLDKTGALRLQLCSDGTWSDLATLGSGYDYSTRCFDIAYTSQSSRALVVYPDAERKDVVYRDWDGSALGPENLLDVPAKGEVRWLSLAPSRVSNEMALVAITDNDQVIGAIWDGAGFVDVRELDTKLESGDYEVAGAVYTDPLGTATFAWARQDSLFAATWRGAWTPAVGAPFVFSSPHMLRLVARPGSLDAIAAILQSDRHLRLLTYRGIAWNPLTYREITTNAASGSSRCFDLAFGIDGTGLLAWGVFGTGVFQCAKWSSTGWTAVASGPDVGGTVRVMQLRADPSANLLHAAISAQPSGSSSGDQRLVLASWTGKWSTATLVTSDAPQNSHERFMLTPLGDICPP